MGSTLGRDSMRQVSNQCVNLASKITTVQSFQLLWKLEGVAELETHVWGIHARVL